MADKVNVQMEESVAKTAESVAVASGLLAGKMNQSSKMLRNTST